MIARVVRPRKLVILALLLATLSSGLVGLVRAVRGLDFWLLLTVTAAGMLIGWGFAALSVRGWAAAPSAFVLGLVGVLVRVGRLGEGLVSLSRALVVLAWEVFEWTQVGMPPDWAPTVRALVDLWTSVGALVTRTQGWAQALMAGDSAFDPVAAALVWSLALWVMSSWAGWIVQRHSRPLLALLPVGTLVAATLSYAGSEQSVLLLLLGTLLLLLASVRYDVRASHWQKVGISFAGLWPDMAGTTFLLTLVLLAAAGMSPSFSVRKIVEFVQQLGRQDETVEAFAESMGVERSGEAGTAEDAFSAVRVTGLPNQHMLGGTIELSKRRVMIVSTGDLPPGPPSIVMRYQWPPRYYWRSHTYDQYVYYGWYVGWTETVEYGAGEPVITTTLPTQRLVQHEVTVMRDGGGLLYATGELVTADQAYSVARRPNNDVFGAFIETSHYRAQSLVPAVSEQQLRSAGSDYPDWVKERYLALPDTVPARVVALARDLTATKPTPYDRARAIEIYLRSFLYTLDVPVPPAGRDVADYFLFELQKGYCDYYATTMVVLARAAGLPARLAVGYVGGSYNAYEAYYVVTEANAHAWVEIYFPGYGWIPFEPTSGFPRIERRERVVPVARSETVEELETTTQQSGFRWRWWLALPAGLVLLVLAGAAWLAIEGWWWGHLEPAVAVAALYGRFRRFGRRLAVPARAGDTPYEFAVTFIKWVGRLAPEGRWSEAIAPSVREARRLTDLYVQASYTSRLPGGDERREAIGIWRRLRWRLWAAGAWLVRKARRSE